MRTLARRRDPRGMDAIALRYAHGFRAAVGSSKEGARVLGVTDRLLRNWFNADPGSPITRAAEVIESVPDPGPLLAEFRISLHRRLLTMDADALVSEFFDVLQQATAAEAQQIMRKVDAAACRDLNALRETSAREAALDERLAAICDRLLYLKVDPWAHRERRRA